jgi:hypothetical protein
MRTTLDLDKPVLDGLKRLQRRDRRSLSRIASSLLAEALARREAEGGSEAPELRWTSSDMGARVNLGDKDALYRALEGK